MDGLLVYVREPADIFIRDLHEIGDGWGVMRPAQDTHDLLYREAPPRVSEDPAGKAVKLVAHSR